MTATGIVETGVGSATAAIAIATTTATIETTLATSAITTETETETAGATVETDIHAATGIAAACRLRSAAMMTSGLTATAAGMGLSPVTAIVTVTVIGAATGTLGRAARQ